MSTLRLALGGLDLASVVANLYISQFYLKFPSKIGKGHIPLLHPILHRTSQNWRAGKLSVLAVLAVLAVACINSNISIAFHEENTIGLKCG